MQGQEDAAAQNNDVGLDTWGGGVYSTCPGVQNGNPGVNTRGGVLDRAGESHLMPGQVARQHVQRGLVDRAAAVHLGTHDLADRPGCQVQLVDLPEIGRCAFSGEKQAFAVKGNLRIAGGEETA